MNDFKYTIDGEKFTFNEICALVPGISRATMNNRILRGWRTWSELKMPTSDAAKIQRKKFASRTNKMISG